MTGSLRVPNRFAKMRQNRRKHDLQRQAAREEFDYCREWMRVHYGVEIDSQIYGEAVAEIDARRDRALEQRTPARTTHTRDAALQAIATAAGLAGAFLLATKGDHAAWGWWAFLASNLGWIAFAWIRRLPWLALQQLGFVGSTAWGLWNWLVLS